MAAHLVLPVSAESPRRARQAVLAELMDDDLDDLADTACLLTSELVTNAVLHAQTEVVLEVEVSSDTVRVAVCDHDLNEPAPEEADPWAARGRGLMLVETLASRWGVDLDADRRGKTIWFELERVSLGAAAKSDRSTR